MSEETARLTLAFVGDQEVHRNNARSLLEDFVEGWLKQHRKAEVKVVLENFPLEATPSQTMADIEDWAATAGYEVVEEYVHGIVKLLLEEPDARLILVGDPNEDAVLYDVVEEAAQYRIQTRSLINGLEKVVFDDEDIDDDLAGEGFHEVDVESGEGWVQDDDLTDEAAALLDAVPDVIDAPEEDAPPDLDLLATLADDGEVAAQEEIKNLALAVDLDVAPYETWADAVAALQGKQIADFYDDPANVVAGDTVEVESLDPIETGADVPTPSFTDAEDVPPEGGVDDLTPSTIYSREQLEAKTFDEVKAIGLDYGIAPGRGMKHGVFVNKILVATGVEIPADQAKLKPKRTRKPKLEAVPDEAVAEAAITADVEGATITPIRDRIDVDRTVLVELSSALSNAAAALAELVNKN